jgi:four helix bundle protein
VAVTPQELRDRTQALGVSAIKLCRELRRNPDARGLADPLRASATSVSANYRVACHARSKREFISKLCIALEEADETVGWLELLVKSDTVTGPVVEDLLKEAREIARILAASRRTAERGRTSRPEGSQ